MTFPALVATAGAAWWVRRRGWRGLLWPWNRWLGGILLALGTLGILALFSPNGLVLSHVAFAEASLGGLLGKVIIGAPDALGTLRAAGLLLVGACLAAPRQARWVARQGGRLARRVGRSAWWLAREVYRRRILQRTALLLVLGPVWLARAVLSRFSVEEGSQRQPGAADDQLPPTAVAAADPSSGSAPDGARLDPAASRNGAAPGSHPDRGRPVPHESAPAPTTTPGPWESPSMDILERPPVEEAPTDVQERARALEEALASYGVQGKVVATSVGPAVTQFGVEPGWNIRYREVRERDEFGRIKVDRNGTPRVHQEEISRTRVKVERITGLANDLALALAAPSVRIEAPVPGKRVVGIEVPNPTPSVVSLRAVLESSGFQRLRTRTKLAIALGQGVSGETVAADLTKMPHLLIAGATGSGKSVCLNSIVASLLMYTTPNEVRMLMIDPKRVEMVPYNDIPHLLAPVIVDAEKVVGTLYFVIKEMETRYKAFAAAGVRNIDGYNKSPKVSEPLPYWVVIIDELADLMMVAPYEVEKSLCRLAQLARATGIHLVVATQRPSVDVVTGLIKANFPTRIAFAVTSQVDSRTILDVTGAEKLLGRGDMLYLPTDAAKPRRIQGTYVSDQEVERLVAFWSQERWQHLRPPQFTEAIEEMEQHVGDGSKAAGPDPLLEKARALYEEQGKISASMLQRKLRIGYVRAARLVEQLKDEGVVDDFDEE
ncbi:MAG: DUF87 domain-containing protein [Chloroflexi bacterium]|nr:DUF87 domain-containing protein [Chloroflexota bacterium]